MYQIQLTMGDPSGDGHREVRTIVYSVNLSSKDISKAYAMGTKSIGLELKIDRFGNYSLPFCEDYEDNMIPEDVVVLLKAAGINLGDYAEAHKHWQEESDDLIPDDDWQLTPEGFAVLWLKIASVGNPKFKYRETIEARDDINIGGYGLFCG